MKTKWLKLRRSEKTTAASITDNKVSDIFYIVDEIS